ncbi:hypothetical protein EU99_1979 [Prochlorococcus marinus str. MIT 9321]|uniref:Uncharacterized protein n=1 Tax=Prochlorococcus marinus str. MIT 9401 TaxID=167551 RepID=A0A0A2B4L9_PROMR|nr:hypothetical protein EU99_1979 [Prochlorococcus marinus str. MIT 9321]KGG05642.1 hypothetical protein EV00_1276 [Prochlorococcus marinus str. MIT 9322]KGG07539.1 hypothetical protein EV01_1154 [Prochlorococcus marinus str. MIT 9401]
MEALGREFKTPRPEWLFRAGQNPPWKKLGKNERNYLLLNLD